MTVPDTGYLAPENSGDRFEAPANLEIEQALLGALLVNNEAMFRAMDGGIEPEHFFEPLHRRIFGVCAKIISDGGTASAVTIQPYFKDDEALQAVGGGQYLARLTVAAVTCLHAEDYARSLRDLATRRDCLEIGETLALEAARPNAEKPTEVIIQDTESKLAQLRGAAVGNRTVWSIGESMAYVLDSHDRIKDGDPDRVFIPTGIRALDNMLGGIERAEMGFVAARPSMGKSAMAAVMMRHAGAAGYNVGYISPDMSHGKTAARIASSWLAEKGLAQVPYEDALKGRLDTDGRRAFQDALEYVESLPIMIDDSSWVTPGHILSRARHWQRELRRSGKELDLLVVDHLHNLRPEKTSRARNAYEAITEISGDLKAAARELNVGMAILCQLSRGDKSQKPGRPTLETLRGSGALEQDARWVTFLHRPWEYADEEPDINDFKNTLEWEKARADWHGEKEKQEHLIEIILAKQNNGPTGLIRAYCEMEHNLILSEKPADPTTVEAGQQELGVLGF